MSQSAPKIRRLEADEIDCRVAQGSEKGVSILLYKDARVDQRILDETFGPMNWQRSHQTIEGRLYCTISIWDESKNAWVSKQDVGTESNTEAEKGQASDSFKRAAFNWGIGRELYSAPFIWIDAKNCELKSYKDRNGKVKYTTYDKFAVKDITYKQNGEIDGLEIINAKTGKTVWIKGKTAPKPAKTNPEPAKTYPKSELDFQAIEDEAKIIDDLESLKDFYKSLKPETLSPAEQTFINAIINKRKQELEK